MATAERLTLKRAVEIMKTSNFTPEYYFEIERMFRRNKVDDKETLESYIRRIMENPDDWMAGFPETLASKGGFGKPKTALLALLKTSHEVRADLGAELCDAAVATLDAAYRKYSPHIIQQRAEAKRKQKQKVNNKAGSEASEHAESQNDEAASVGGSSIDFLCGHMHRTQADPAVTANIDLLDKFTAVTLENAKLQARVTQLQEAAECLAGMVGDMVESMDDSHWHTKSLRRTLNFYLRLLGP